MLPDLLTPRDAEEWRAAQPSTAPPASTTKRPADSHRYRRTIWALRWLLALGGLVALGQWMGTHCPAVPAAAPTATLTSTTTPAPAQAHRQTHSAISYDDY